MNSKFVKFAAKISFSCYLIHYMVLLYLNHTFFVTPTYLIREVTYLFVGCLVITMIAGTFLTMLVEMPFGAI
jgi:peptidoglycan/LPS O-acetylase OafA/YrhL